MAAIGVGDFAPNFSAVTQTGRTVSLADYAGKALVLFFFPKAFTPVCTQEACSFRDAYQDFVDAGASVLGVSSDSAANHQAFADRYKLPYDLIADTQGNLRRAFGVPAALWLFPGRVTYLIDSSGVVRHVFNSTLQGKAHMQAALKAARELVALSPTFTTPTETNRS